MLGYDQWANHSSSPPPNNTHPNLMLSDVVDNLNLNHHHRNHDLNNNYGQDHGQLASSQSIEHHNRSIFDNEHFTPSFTLPHNNPTHNHNNNSFYQNQLFNDPRAFQSYPNPNPTPNPSMFNLGALSGPTGFAQVMPKHEPDPNSRPIGLDLGGRTYFSPDDDLMSRLYRRSRPADMAANAPKCQAEGCNADLSNAKHYHRRHKVCEFHSKSSTVIAGGLIQRFCQQCSRFHLLAEFDNGKRSCRKRLADHNRRRRKSNQVATQESRMVSSMSSENPRTSPSQSN